MRLDVGSRTDLGRVRKNNEDSFRIEPALNLFVLSDGMGGEAHGEVASAIAVETVIARCQEMEKTPAAVSIPRAHPEVSPRTNLLANAITLANQKVFETAAADPENRGMGATIVAAWIDGQRLSIAHVGDSRAYLLRAGSLDQLTADHSLVAEQVRQGILTPQEAESSELQSVLTRALGSREDVEVDADEQVLLEKDIIVLCCDGLTRMVTDPEIASTLLMSESAQAAADRLVDLANENGGEDNVTVIVVRAIQEVKGIFTRFKLWKRNSGRRSGV